LFCDGPPANPFAPLPIAQSGENIIFGVTQDPTTGTQTVVAHIQIFYSGPADKFSWIVPVDAPPTVGVGSDSLFTAVAGVTKPTFYAETVVEGTCKAEAQVPSAAGAGGSSGSFSSDGAADAGGPPGVQVIFSGAVGPYQTAVIHSTDRTSSELVQWLKDNGYYVGADAVSIIDEYVLENKYFVAVRLQNGKDVQSIQPVVLKFSGADPCVPLRLTAIAALNDLRVNLWVLGSSRAVPKNYFEIKLNDAKLNWLQGGFNYAQLVKEAADEAGGNAFIAEYAGTARILDRALWPNASINLDSLRAQTEPPGYLQALVNQRLTTYAPLLSLLRVYIPEPQVIKDMGIPEALFYSNNQLYWQQYRTAFAPFDPAKLTDEIDRAIVAPLRDGQALFDAHPYLTSLATYISPIEMTRDPIFIFNDELPPFSNVHKAAAHVMCGAQRFRYCEAPVQVVLPDGRSIWQEHLFSYCGKPSTTDGDLLDLPSLDSAYQRAEGGEGTRVADNSALITKTLLQHNRAVATALELPPSALAPDGTPASPVGSSPGATSVGSGGACGCRVGGAPGVASATLGLLLGLALLRRQRRR
jgi:MYXO-CTERM domain-containing protein